VADSELSTATVKVVVTGAPFDGTITLAGELSRPVNDAPVSLSNPANGISVTVVDSTGKELNRALTWDAKELPARGILVEDGQISFTQEGTFHVRAASGGVYSDWFEVTALPARALTSLVIADPYDPPLLSANLDPDGPEIDLSGLRVTALDQYGDPVAFDPADLVWALDGPETASILDGTSLIDATQAGRWTVTATTGGLTSNALDVTIVGPEEPGEPGEPGEPVVTGFTVSTRTLTEAGGEVTATITGTDLPSTAVVTVDGASGASATAEHPTTGGSTVRTATFTLPANTAGTAEVYTVGYRLGAPGGPAGATTAEVIVAPSLAIDPEDEDDGEGEDGTGTSPGSKAGAKPGAGSLPFAGYEPGVALMALLLLALGFACVHTARRRVRANRA
jgi:hypothetical protein